MTEWELNHKIFHKINKIWEPIQLNLFATQNNKQIENLISPFPTSQAITADAISMNWN